MVEIVPKYQIIPIDILLQCELEADTVCILVLRVRWDAEVRRCVGGAAWETSIVLWKIIHVSVYSEILGRTRIIRGELTCIRTFKSACMRSDSIDTGSGVLTGTSLWVVGSYCDPAVTRRV